MDPESVRCGLPSPAADVEATGERCLYIDFKMSGGVCELTSYYKSRRKGYSEAHEFIALTPIDIPPTTAEATTALLDRVIELMGTCNQTEATLTIDGGEFYRVVGNYGHVSPDSF